MGILQNIRLQQIFKQISPVHDGREPDVRHSKIAVRGSDEVFYVHNAGIRCTKLSKSQTYQVIDVPDIDFDAQGVKMNSSGTLLAVYNEANITVVTLPSSNSLSESKSPLRVKSFRIGNSTFDGNLIRDLTWNILARLDSTLVVLSSDGLIRSFDLSVSSSVPDTYDLKLSSRHHVGIVNNSISNPISISFGSKSTLAGSLSLFVLNDDGDVFSIYPFLPKALAISQDDVEDLLNETVLLTNEMVDNSSTPLRRQVVSQLKFTKALWRQIPTSLKEIRGPKELCVLYPETPGTPSIQGPFAIQPYPEDLYNDSAFAIACIPCGQSSLLAVSYSENGFSLLLQDPRHMMKFYESDMEQLYELDGVEGESNDYLVLALLRFFSSSIKTPCKISVIGESISLLQRGSDLFEIDLKNFDQYMNRSTSEDQDCTDLSRLTPIRRLKSLDTGETFEGAALFKDEFGAIISAVVTSKTLDVFSESNDDGKNESENDSEEIPVNVPYDMISKLGLPFFEIQKLAKGLSSVAINPPTNTTVSLASDETSLRSLDNVSTQVLKHLMNFHRLGLSLNYRVANQKSELQRQIEAASKTSKKLEVINNKSPRILSELERCSARQERIGQRVHELAYKLQGSVNIPLSSPEKDWFKEIQKHAIYFNKYAKQSMVLSEQLRYVKSELDSRSNLVAKGNPDVELWESIAGIMKEGRDIMDQTSSSLTSSMQNLNEHMKDIQI